MFILYLEKCCQNNNFYYIFYEAENSFFYDKNRNKIREDTAEFVFDEISKFKNFE